MTTKEHPLDLRGAERDLLLRRAADARRRLDDLAVNVRDHEASVRSQIGGPRTHDLLLYRRLRQVGGGPAPADAVTALLEAVRAHQVLTKNRAVPRRPADHALYRRAGLA